MKSFLQTLFKTLALSFIFVFGALITHAWAQAIDPGSVVIPDGDFLMSLWASIGSIKGLSAMGIVVVVVQVIMAASQTSFVESHVPGKIRLVIVYGLSLILGVLSLHVAGVDWVAALLHSNTLAAFQVLAQNVYKQFFTAKGDQPIVA